MFFKVKSKETIKKNVMEAGLAACECHGDVRRSIGFAFKENGINATCDMVNEMANEVFDAWQKSDELKERMAGHLWTA